MLHKINLSGKEFPILFSLNAIEEIQNRYKDIGELGAKLYDFAETKWLLRLIVNEGIAYENYMDGTHQQPITEQQIGFLVNLGDLENGVVDTIVKAFSDFGCRKKLDSRAVDNDGGAGSKSLNFARLKIFRSGSFEIFKARIKISNAKRAARTI